MRAHTSNNGITLHLPGEVNARLSAATSNASISSDFEMRMRGEISKHHIEGTLGNGGPLIDLSTSNGQITDLEVDGCPPRACHARTLPYCTAGAPARMNSAISEARARAVCM